MKDFVAGSTARTAAELRNTAIRFFHNLRVKIALKQQQRHDQFYGSVALEESRFGGVRKGTVVKIGETEVPKAKLLFLAF